LYEAQESNTIKVTDESSSWNFDSSAEKRPQRGDDRDECGESILSTTITFFPLFHPLTQPLWHDSGSGDPNVIMELPAPPDLRTKLVQFYETYAPHQVASVEQV
jgi:hypothetical protein